MPATIEIKIEGEDIRPDTVPLRDLLDLLGKFDSAFEATSFDNGVRREDIRISLVGVDKGSDLLTLATDDKTYEYAQLVVDAISRQDAALVPLGARRPINEVQSKATTRGWRIGVSRRMNGTLVSTANILPATNGSPLFEEEATVTATTTIAAYLIRCGGDKSPTANIRLPSHETLTAKVASLELAETLGGYLYQYIELTGEATWSTSDWSLRQFRITGIGAYRQKQSDPIAALSALSEASEGFWDNVNPSEYIKELRSD